MFSISDHKSLIQNICKDDSAFTDLLPHSHSFLFAAKIILHEYTFNCIIGVFQKITHPRKGQKRSEQSLKQHPPHQGRPLCCKGEDRRCSESRQRRQTHPQQRPFEKTSLENSQILPRGKTMPRWAGSPGVQPGTEYQEISRSCVRQQGSQRSASPKESLMCPGGKMKQQMCCTAVVPHGLQAQTRRAQLMLM